jgi:hypothetical protein
MIAHLKDVISFSTTSMASLNCFEVHLPLIAKPTVLTDLVDIAFLT